jgi:hypothetical protein
MAEERPRLSAVPDVPEGSAEVEQAAGGERQRTSPLFWIFAAAFAICALGWFFQAREARELAASLEVTRIALDEARTELRAYDRHLTEVGNRVGVLQEQLDALQALVEEGPRREAAP